VFLVMLWCAVQSLSHPGIPQYIDYFEEDTATDRAFYIVQVTSECTALTCLAYHLYCHPCATKAR
jgi:hypothetical protein